MKKPESRRAIDSTSRTGEAHEPERRVGSAPTTPKILIVDDEPICIKAMRKYLKEAGYDDFLTTTESTNVIDLMKNGQPDLVLLDYLMPGMNGLEVLRLRSLDSTLRHIPIVVVTASREEGVKVQALELGATDFLAKPIDPNELVPRVHNILNLKAYHDRLTSLNARLEEKVQEQTKALQKAYDKLKDLDRLKQEFLSLVSHELRTPVTGISASIELLAAQTIECEIEEERVLDIALGQAMRLQSIIRDVELFLNLTAGNVKLQRAPLDLRGILAEKRLEWNPRAKEKGLSISLEGFPSISVSTDYFALVSALERLIDNAIKFTDRGEITLTARTAGDMVALEVKDSGRGIEEVQKERIMQPLSIGENLLHHSEGHGLGLAIIRLQMQLLGGRIEFESEGSGKGSTFRLLIPAAAE